MSELEGLPNIGKVTKQLLMESEINTKEELLTLGSKAAFLRIRQIDKAACLHMLYGLEGAVQGIKDTLLTRECKEDLKEFFNGLQSK